jgi:hypothetical protein
LAGIAWNEVGGTPDFFDHVAFPIRSFDWSGPAVLDRNLTITKDPDRTSFGSVSVQLRVAAETLGLDIRRLGFIEKEKLAQALSNDIAPQRSRSITSVQISVRALIIVPTSCTRALRSQELPVTTAQSAQPRGRSFDRGQLWIKT